MKQFKIYVNPQGYYEAVKQGWSWPAFFFIWLWAVVKKMWSLGVGVFVAYLVKSLIIFRLSKEGRELVNILDFLVHLIFGAGGNKWRENNLLKRGFEHKDTVNSANPEGAIALFLKNNVD